MSNKITNIVFTRNRPLQLEAYLESFLGHMGNAVGRVYILYKQDLFESEYEQVFKAFPQCTIIREEDFHQDFMRVFEQIDTDYMVFATDDVVYFDSVDFELIHETFAGRKDIFGFTLKFGLQHFADGKEPITEELIGEQKVYKVNWKTARDAQAAYPFELNCTVYRTSFVREILGHTSREYPRLQRIFFKDSLMLKLAGLFTSRKRILYAINTFHCPNTIEGSGYRWCRGNKWRLPKFLYFQKICATTLQVNRVNTTVANPVYGTDEHSVETLNAKYQQGYRLDLEFLRTNKPAYVRMGQEYFHLRPKETANNGKP